MKNILVTGGAGFIGSHLVEKLLIDGHNVRVIDNLNTGKLSNLSFGKNFENFKFIQADIRSIKEIRDYFKEIDVVFHLAALAEIVPSIEDPKKYFETNVTGTLNVLENSRENKIKKIIYAASGSCYGLTEKVPTDENQKISPMYPYALTKFLGEELIMHWSFLYKLSAISLRLFNVYGPRSRTSGTYGAVFGVFLAQKLVNKPFTVVGDGNQTRDFTYVTDVVDSMIACAFSNIKNEIFNIGSNQTYSINQLTDLLGGKKIYIPKRPGEPDCTWADISKIKKYIGWYPKITFEQGVKKILANISYWKDAPIWDEKKINNATKEWFKFLK